MVLSECLETKAESDLSGINELKKQVAELKSQLAALMKQRKPTAPKKEQPKKPETKKKKNLIRQSQTQNSHHLTSSPQSQSLGTVFIVGKMVTLLPLVKMIQNLP